MPRQSKPWFRAASGTWVSRVRGKLVTLAHGKGAKAEAAAKLRSMLACHQVDFATVTDHFRDAVSLEELKDQFLKFCKGNLAPSTSERWTKLVGRFVRDIGGDRPASGLVSLDLLRWAEGTGWNRTTRTNGIGAVQRMFSWGVQMRLLLLASFRPCGGPEGGG